MGIELERKWIPSHEFFSHVFRTTKLENVHDIKQGYLADDASKVMRIRLTTTIGVTKGYLTIKTRRPEIGSNEFEYFIPTQDAEELFNVATHSISKTRFEYDGWELDVFNGRHEGFIMVEREFDTEEEYRSFDAPDGFVEVTGNPQFTNNHLARASDAEVQELIRFSQKIVRGHHE